MSEDLRKKYEAETGEEALYRKGSSDYHTLRYVRWLESQLADKDKQIEVLAAEKEGLENNIADWMEKDANHLVANATLSEQLAEAKAEIEKLNLILFHRENGLSHPDLQGEVDKSKLTALRSENAELRKVLKELYFSKCCAFCETNEEIVTQALTPPEQEKDNV